MILNFLPFLFFSLLSAALIGWLVGWLLSRLGKGRSSESLDAELAGKMRLLEDERDRLQFEIADLKAAFRAQLDKTNSEQSVTGDGAAEAERVTPGTRSSTIRTGLTRSGLPYRKDQLGISTEQRAYEVECP